MSSVSRTYQNHNLTFSLCLQSVTKTITLHSRYVFSQLPKP